MNPDSLPHVESPRQARAAARFAVVRALAMPLAIVVAAAMIANTFGPWLIYMAAFAPLGVAAGFEPDTPRRVVWGTAAIAEAVAVGVALLVWAALHQYGPWGVVIAMFGGFPLGTLMAAVWGAVTAHRHAARRPERLA